MTKLGALARGAVSWNERERSISNTFEHTTVVVAKPTLVDTSIWVAVLRPAAAPRLESIVRALSGSDMIWISRLIVAELIAGARDQKIAMAIERYCLGFHFCNDAINLFRQGAFVQLGVQRLHPTPPACGIIDAYLAVLAAHDKLHVLTADAAMAKACSFLRVRGALYHTATGAFAPFPHPLRRRKAGSY